MEKQTWYCVFYVFLLMSITPAMCRRRSKKEQSENRNEKRFAAALLPSLPALAGTAVVPWLYFALVAAYGLSALVYYGITKDRSQDRCYPQNVCARNRGHCRDPQCWSHEYPLWQNADECGGACPCCVDDYVYEQITGKKPPPKG